MLLQRWEDSPHANGYLAHIHNWKQCLFASRKMFEVDSCMIKFFSLSKSDLNACQILRIRHIINECLCLES